MLKQCRRRFYGKTLLCRATNVFLRSPFLDQRFVLIVEIPVCRILPSPRMPELPVGVRLKHKSICRATELVECVCIMACFCCAWHIALQYPSVDTQTNVFTSFPICSVWSPHCLFIREAVFYKYPAICLSHRVHTSCVMITCDVYVSIPSSLP